MDEKNTAKSCFRLHVGKLDNDKQKYHLSTFGNEVSV